MGVATVGNLGDDLREIDCARQLASPFRANVVQRLILDQ